jgi:hypothetical protein
MTEGFPGTPFTGRRSPLVDVPSNVAIITTILSAGVPPGFTSTVLPGVGAYDVSQFQSLKVDAHATMNVTVPYFGIRFEWALDAAFLYPVMTEQYVFESGGAITEGVVVAQAPFVRLRISNYDSGLGTISVNVYGSSRAIPRSQFHTIRPFNAETLGLGADNVLVADSAVVAPGATFVYGPIAFYNGPVVLRMKCTNNVNVGKNLVSFQWNAQPEGVFNATSHLTFNVPADSTFSATLQPIVTTVYFPRRVMSLTIQNNDAVNRNVGFAAFAGEI